MNHELNIKMKPVVNSITELLRECSGDDVVFAMNCVMFAMRQHSPDDYNVAKIYRELKEAFSESAPDDKRLAIARRVFDISYSVDEARFTNEDYVDAIVYGVNKPSFEELLALDDDDFCETVIDMAVENRRRYASDYEYDDFEDNADDKEFGDDED